MDNEGIVKVVSELCNPIELVAKTTCKVKDEDFVKKIDYVLSTLDCDAYKDDARAGFRIFAKELKAILPMP